MAPSNGSQGPDLNNLDACSTPDLRAQYLKIIGQRPPQRASRDFLLGNLSWALQARQSKQNPAALRDQLIRQSNPTKPRLSDRYQPGTRLVREWHGQTYEVIITDKGYRWQGQHYRSLTGIAREITGANWSGPRFFGLNEASR